MDKQPHILGLDPANSCGWAHDSDQSIMSGVWLLKEKSDKHPGRRLERIRRKLFRLKREFKIDAIGVEKASLGSKFAATQAVHNELSGVIKLCAMGTQTKVARLKEPHPCRGESSNEHELPNFP